MGIFQRTKHTEDGNLSEGNGHVDPEKEVGTYDDSPVKFLTVRSMLMGVLVSMGGFIFGYDTGRLSSENWNQNQLANVSRRSDLGIPSDARLSPALRRASSVH